MVRIKKVKEDVKKEVKQEIKEISYGTGWTGKNNKIQAELREVKKNE